MTEIYDEIIATDPFLRRGIRFVTARVRFSRSGKTAMAATFMDRLYPRGRFPRLRAHLGAVLR